MMSAKTCFRQFYYSFILGIMINEDNRDENMFVKITLSWVCLRVWHATAVKLGQASFSFSFWFIFLHTNTRLLLNLRQLRYGAGGFSYKSTWTLQELFPLIIMVVNICHLKKQNNIIDINSDTNNETVR